MEKFQVIQPSPLLAPYVKQYWFLTTDDARQQQRIIPNGTICLVFHRGVPLFSISKHEQQPRSFISGQTSGYTDLAQSGIVDMISLTFQPHGAKAFFDIPLNEFYGATVSIHDIGDSGLTDFPILTFALVNRHKIIGYYIQFYSISNFAIE